MIKMHAAQYLSFMRLVLAPLCMLYLCDIPYKKEIVIFIVLLAGITDFLDGYIARSQGTTSYFGAVLDFTADKLFVLSMLMVLSLAGVVPFWITLIILYREVMVMGLRIFASFHRMEIPSSIFGKIKTWITFMAILAVLIELPYSYYLFLFVLALTIFSFLDYLKNFIAARGQLN